MGVSVWFVVYSIGSMALPCMVYQMILLIKERRAGKRCSTLHGAWVCIFLLYIWMVFEVTGVGTLGDILRTDTKLLMGNINFRPFESLGVGYVLNIIMCMPLGFLLPLIWKELRKLWKTALIGFGFSAAIEITQLFNWRATDVDDLIANTLGAVLGYLVWKAFCRMFGQRLKTSDRGWKESVFCLAAALLGTFFLYNPYLLYSKL